MAKSKKSDKTKKPNKLKEKSLKKLKKLAQRKPDFSVHLDMLVRYYGVETHKLPTPDEILTGIWEPTPLDVSEIVVLMPALVEMFSEVWDRYKKPNVWSDKQFANLITFADTIPEELSIMLSRQIEMVGFQMKNTPDGVHQVALSPTLSYWTRK